MKKFTFSACLLSCLWLCFSANAQAPLKADFTVSNYAGCSPVIAQFTNTSSGGAVRYSWRFGNGNTSTKKDPGAAYYKAGKYDVTLIVKDNKGNVDSVTKTGLITVYDKPEADFSASKTRGCYPLTVDFTDESSSLLDSIATRTWDFGDGTLSNDANPQHTYQNPGTYDVTLAVENFSGCKSSKIKKKYIVAVVQPNADFSASAVAACKAPFKVSFTPANADKSKKYSWSFGDGTTSKLVSPDHTYQSDGSFEVSLTVSDTGGCSTTVTKTGLINIGREKANFTLSDTTGCEPLVVKFSKSSSAPALKGSTYFWDFGDGTTSSLPNPAHKYKTAGKYNVRLTVLSASGCLDSLVKKDAVVVKAAPKVDFSLSDSAACTGPFTVTFTNKTIGGKTYTWYFGDGSVSYSVNPQHTYQNPGAYTVKLRADGANGCSSVFVKENAVIIKAPEAGFSMNVSEGCKPLQVSFTNATSSVAPLKGMLWRFGNGSTSTLNDPKISFADTGRFNVTLIVQTKDGCTDSISRMVKVGNKPHADFEASPLNVCIGLHVSFKNLTNTYTQHADSFFWDFGDGSYSADPNPVHTYNCRPGNYSVRLTAFHNGCADTFERKGYIAVKVPMALFSYSKELCHPQYVSFENKSIGADSVHWDFGDGATSSDSSPNHLFEPGTYTVTLSVKSNKTQCVNVLQKEVVIPEKLTASFFSNDTLGCLPYQVQFTATSNQKVSWLWDFGNGQTSKDQNPATTYKKEGFYTVKLTVTNPDGCTFTLERVNYIHAIGADVHFNISTNGGCTPLKVRFVNLSTSRYKIIGQEWDFGDGVKFSGFKDTIEHIYYKPNNIQKKGYRVTLKLTDSFGCEQSLTRIVYPAHPRPAFEIKQEATCSSLSYHFSAAADDTTGIGPLQYKWRFEDGSTSSQKEVTRTFTKSGNYKVVLKVTDMFGCTDSLVKILDVKILVLKAGFKATPMVSSCPPARVSFIDTTHAGFGKIASYQWYFGDGSTSALQYPEKLYRKAGQYHVSLKVTDSLGCSDSFSLPQPIVVKGPIGTYTFDKKTGCAPLSVQCTAATKNTSKIVWDLGDGTIAFGAVVKHTYKQAGEYIPLLILSDSFGCTYTLPPTDTLRAFSLPGADFEAGSNCADDPVQFTWKGTGMAEDSTISGWLWNFGDGTTSTEKNPAHTYSKTGSYLISLQLINDAGCSASASKKIKIMGGKAGFSAATNATCMLQPIQFNDESQADTAIAAWHWDFGDGGISNETNPVHAYSKAGAFDISLSITTANGCHDSVMKKAFILIGDTAAPVNPSIFRATVETDKLVRLEFSKYKGMDFKAYQLFRKGEDGEFESISRITDAADTVYLDYNVNALAHSYAYKVMVETFCGIKTSLDNVSEHRTMNLEASPDTNAAVLSWNPYEGWPVSQYNIYREDVHSKGSFLLIGSVNGNTSLFRDTAILCYQTHSYRIEAVESNSGRTSWSDTATARPVYIPRLKASELAIVTVDNDSYIHLRWSSTNARTKYFMLERSEDGINYSSLADVIPAGDGDYIDRDADVHAKLYYYRLRYVDSCGDVSPYSSASRNILLHIDTAGSGRPRLSWTDYTGWKYGVKYYEIQVKQADGSFLTLYRTIKGQANIYEDKVTDLNSLPSYCYRVLAYRDMPGYASDAVSYSNEACSQVESHVWVPSAFTPNNDGLNEKLEIKGQYLKEYHLEIFNRWGELLFQSESPENQWDGRFNGDYVPGGTYIYSLKARGADNRSYYLKGTFNLMR